ncbi:MAG: CopG family transcriptional regulator [Gemmatimonadales bacterium]|nr:CopG family transcriptional regulator [Gemmatimonadales bacterium]
MPRCPALQVRLPPAIRDALDARAREAGVTISDLARELLGAALGVSSEMPPRPPGPGRARKVREP